MREITERAEATLSETDKGQVCVAQPPVLATPAAVVALAGCVVATAAVRG
ncbi:hypothetical protein ABTZ59_25450 [Streptomyces sp. NPDC094034]